MQVQITINNDMYMSLFNDDNDITDRVVSPLFVAAFKGKLPQTLHLAIASQQARKLQTVVLDLARFNEI